MAYGLKGGRPACAGCLKRGEVCLYQKELGHQAAVFDSPGWFADSFVDNFPAGFDGWQSTTDVMLAGIPLSHTNGATMLDSSESTISSAHSNLAKPYQPADSFLTSESHGSSSPADTILPALEELSDIIEFFFERFYDSLPIFHKYTLVSSLLEGTEKIPNVLLYAILAVTSSSYPNKRVRQNSDYWYTAAKTELSKVMASSQHPHQTLQAALLVVFESMMKGEFNHTWLTLGEAWRKAVAIGYGQVVGMNHKVMFMLGTKTEKTWIELEECRRIVWTLFMFDRGACFPIGIVHAIDDRRLVVQFPMREDVFQGLAMPVREELAKYTRGLSRLVTSMQQQTRNGTGSQLQYIILAYILLGRITEEVYTPDFDYERQCSALDELSEHLVRIRLTLPHSAVDVSAAGYTGGKNVVWLVSILSTASILLHHRPIVEGETLETSTTMASNWPHCVGAARDIVRAVRDASRASNDFGVNLHMIMALFLCFRTLATEYYSPSRSAGKGPDGSTKPKRDAATRADLEVLVNVFERLKESRQQIGRKYYNGVKFYMRQDETVIMRAKALGAGGLLTTCESWMDADDGEAIIIRD